MFRRSHDPNFTMLLFLLFIIAAPITSTGHGDRGRADAGYLKPGGMNRTSCSESERRALLAIRSDMYSSGRWLSSWKGDDCYNWRGVACDTITGHVTRLDLRYPHRKVGGEILASKINPSLLELKHLNHLDLSMNDFAGVHIPKMLASMVHLEYLNLSSAMFGGPIPPQLGSLSSLHYLDLSNCDCSSRYDDSQACPQLQTSDLSWLSPIPTLQYLDVSCVKLSRSTNWLQQINSIPSLRVVHLGNACLPHVSSPSPPFNLTSISLLDLSGCLNLSTAVLSWLSNASSLEYLYLQHCYLGLQREPLQHALASLPYLKALNLSNCSMSGDISGIARNVSRRLKHLDLSSNSLAGHIPPSFWELRHLEYLDLFNNTLSGHIPETLGNLTSLRHLNLAQNEITGEIPETVGNLMRLEFLRLSYNHIVGKIPPVIGNLTNLIYLRMGSNNINGHIPKTLGNLIHLESLSLTDNNISGKIPEALGNLKNLHVLWPYENSIHGQIPTVIDKLYNLQDLDVSDNHLTGHIPRTFGKLCNLGVLDLSSNNIGGRITLLLDALSNCTHGGTRLQELILKGNNFTGTIPLSLGQLSLLQLVDLSENSLVSNITEAHFFKLRNLRHLVISYNSLSIILPSDWIPPFNADTILLDRCHMQVTLFPSWIRTQTNLVILSLSGVGLAGNIPPWFSDPNFIFCNTNLRILDLGYNNLTGNIPECHTSFPTSLLYLRLNNNSLSGPIPPFLKYCTQLKILDLDDNKFSEEAPRWLGRRFSSLRVLRLSSNRFHGTIPLSIGNLISLQILDLSSNNFSGSIPPSLGNLRAMIVPSNDDPEILHYDNNGYYFPVFITAKGLSYKYRISQVTSIDFSNNNLSDQIPEELTNLPWLLFLRLSNNHLIGRIPENIGAMKQLESLDLSMNNLTGEIPSSLSNLSFLEHLNLSYNDLSGRIPKGNQLQTFDDPSFFVGNKNLCGFPLPECSTDAASSHSGDHEESGDKLETILNYAFIVMGFAVGFWVSFGTLFLKQSMRNGLFRWVDKHYDNIYVQLAIRFAKKEAQNIKN